MILVALGASRACPADLADLVRESSIRGGLIVHLGCGDGEQTAELRINDRFLVHGLDTNGERIEQARKAIQLRGRYGPVAVASYDGRNLPYADNAVNLLIVEDPAQVGEQEMRRVLVPNGIALLEEDAKWRTIAKPRPEEMDDWPQWLHGPDNVLVSQDTMVGPPRRLQWVGGPPWARMHNDLEVPATTNVILSANGRVFYDMDAGLPDSDRMPSRFFLVARDAFNGVLLWKRPLESWYRNVEYRRGNPPVVIQRRVVCDGDKLYVTTSNKEPIVVLDAATGETLKTFEATRNAHELVLAEKKLFVVVWEYGEPYDMGYHLRRQHAYVTNWAPGDPPKGPSGKNRGILSRQETVRTSLLAVDPQSGDILWQRGDDGVSQILPQTLASDNGQVYLKTPTTLLCLDAETGKTIWSSDVGLPIDKNERIPKWFLVTKPNVWYWNVQNVSRVIVLEDKVLTVAQDQLCAVSRKNGEQLWRGPSYPGFVSPPDVLPVGDKVYVGKEMGEGGYIPIDLKTGSIEPEIVMEKGGMIHHRCYRRLATSRYLLSSLAGIEFYEIATGQRSANQWTRGNCFAGFLPANGLIYTTPHPCACFTRAKMNGMLAYAPKKELKSDRCLKQKLQKGPAYDPGRLGRQPNASYRSVRNSSLPVVAGAVDKSTILNSGDTCLQSDRHGPLSADWPTYRQDPGRGGSAPGAVPAELKLAWRVGLDTRLSPPSVAGGKIYVAAIDRHTVCAFDANSGEANWSYTAGGRVDTPPTIFGGLAVFGCKDGWTYCLRADDGKLVWRFHGGPTERMIGVLNQLESAWPVHGAVLVLTNPAVNDGRPTVYLAAGRNTFLDSGIRVYALDLASGEVIASHVLHGPYGDDGSPIVEKTWVIKGVKADILVSDGNYLYIKDVVLNLDCSEAKTAGGNHLLATGRSLLDDYRQHRSLWVLGTSAPYTPHPKTAGNLMAFHGLDVFVFRSHAGRRNSSFDPAAGYDLARVQMQATSPAEGQAKRRDASRRPRTVWTQKSKVICKALVHTGTARSEPSQQNLFIAGPVNPKEPRAVEAALRGNSGGVLCALSAEDGRQLAEYNLDSIPVHDGMAAAHGRLYLSLRNGTLCCFEGAE